MRKHLFPIMITAVCALPLCACQSSGVDYHTDDTPFTLPLAGETLRIMQITDLHLTYGIDYNDRKTFRLIDRLAEVSAPDLIVMTGDISMSPLGPILFSQFIDHMESLGIPWTFVFGNHETDFENYASYLARIHDTTHLLFKSGPDLSEGGWGNFRITVEKSGNPFYQLYLMDSHTENDWTLSGYDYVHLSQVNWYRDHVADDQTAGLPSLAFMHIPLMQYADYATADLIDGVMDEGEICYQGIDTGLFDAMTEFGMTKGVFVGHDHNNDFSFMDQGILLAYGQTSGYNGYGFLERGARIIDVDDLGHLSSFLLTESTVVL